MKYLGVDYGSKRIGISVSNSDGTVAFPRVVMPNDSRAIAAVEELVLREFVDRVVVGDTRALSGEANPVTSEVETFMKKLESILTIPVIPMWEVWSSVEAARYAPKGHEHDDSAAAAFILQRYLDMRGNL